MHSEEHIKLGMKFLKTIYIYIYIYIYIKLGM